MGFKGYPVVLDCFLLLKRLFISYEAPSSLMLCTIIAIMSSVIVYTTVLKVMKKELAVELLGSI